MTNETTPKISIITPSYNQARYIEQTIQSVLHQDYGHAEHIVIDGGSTDGTPEILKRYEHLLWISEKDRGQADALNKGLALAKGDIIGWINSDDYYHPNIFASLIEHFSDPAVLWVVGNISYVDEQGALIAKNKSPEITYRRLIRNPDIVRQQATFFRREFIKKAGGLDDEFFMAMDFDLWVRLAKLSLPKMVDHEMAFFRLHAHQKTGISNIQRQLREIVRVLKTEHVAWPVLTRVYLMKQFLACKLYTRSLLIACGMMDNRAARAHS